MSEKKSTKNIRVAFFLTLSFSIIELVGGILTNSTAIITDALHDFCDSISIAVSWILEKKSEKKPDLKYTYGYGRLSVLGALINSVMLIVSTAAALIVAVPRIINPAAIHYDGVLLLAVFGLVINGYAAFRTAKGKSLNEKTISLHLLEDVLGWASVLVTGVVMKFLDLPILDPILSIVIAAYMLFNVVRNLKKIFEVFLEKAPNDVSVDGIKEHLLRHEAIKDIHHVHLWSLDGMLKYITLHASVCDTVTYADDIIAVKNFIKEELAEHGITHSSVELEFAREVCGSVECRVESGGHGHFGHDHAH
jgi:cobalt-zinc-cadmium efflux system protein